MKALLITALILFIVPLRLLAGVETFSERIEGGSGNPGSIYTNANYSVYDDKYMTMATDNAWQSQFSNYKVTNRIRLGINPELIQTGAISGSVTLLIKSWSWNATTSTFVTASTTQTLAVNYLATPTDIMDELATYAFSNAHRVEVTIQSFTGGTAFTNSVYLQSEIEVERYYAFSGNSPISPSISIYGEYYQFDWSQVVGAEYYELEWVHVNDYKASNVADFYTTSELSVNFYRNATRVIVRTPYYRIPKLFDRGYLVFRVRAIGLTGTNFTSRKEGIWNMTENMNLSSLTANTHYVYVSGAADLNMNWGHQVLYAENGKRFESVSFADGLGRSRQSLGHNTETGQVIVSNTYLDGYGRPTISDLPTPDDNEGLVHRLNFNHAQGATSFGAANFEQIYIANSPSCSFQTTPFATDAGAGKYYSPSNTDQDGENARIPDAQQYPFARVEYMDDHSGRIRRMGGVGPDFQIGSGHETEFFYSTPTQEEMDRLFGSEVGYNTHYQKRITVDANEQAYVEYFDMAGRVIASGLIGTAPANLTQLDNNTTFNMTQTITDGLNGEVTPISMTLTQPLTITSGQDYAFSYDLNPSQFTNATCAPTICFDCMYTLKIEITTEECDQVLLSKTKKINGGVYDAICNGTSYPYGYDTSVFLPKNNYILTKTLTVDQDAINAYWCTYLENNTCIPTFQEIYNEEYLKADFGACDNVLEYDESDEQTCATTRVIMLHDLSPGGQYAEYTESGSTYTAPSTISVLNTSTILTGNWKTPVGYYADVQGAQAWVEVTYDATLGVYSPAVTGTVVGPLANGNYKVKPEQLANLKDFVDRFESSWANALITFHPEYCYLSFCETNTASHDYDVSTGDITTFTDACNGGYFAPLGTIVVSGQVPSGTFACNTSLGLDPFFTANPSYAAAMQSKLTSYINIGGTNYSMLDYAIILNNCPTVTTSAAANTCLRDFKASCNIDAVWLTFHQLYLEAKELIYADAEDDYIATQSCGAIVPQIGAPTIPSSPFNETIPRWGFYQEAVTTTYTTDPSIGATAQSLTVCETACDEYANDWLLILANCPAIASMNTTQQTALHDDLSALCAYGCSNSHPGGATTLPSVITPTSFVLPGGGSLTAGAGINEVLALHIAGFTESDLCTELLISDPGPYQLDLGESVYLDTCGCDLLLSTKQEFLLGNLPSGITTIEQLLAFNTGLEMDDIDALICKCSGVATAWVPNYVWQASEQTTIGGWYESVPQELTCDDCITCEQTTIAQNDLVTRFGIDITTTENYPLIMTNFFNETFGFDLTYSQYSEFLMQCSATELLPVCQPTDQLISFGAVLNLLAHRGQLMTPAQTPLDLVAQNVVYKKSDLRDYLAATSYSTLLTGSTLQLTFIKGETTLPCATSLVLPENASFTYDDIVAFGHIFPIGGTCGTATPTFGVEVRYYECGELVLDTLTGSTDCFPVQTCYCGGPVTLCNESVGEQFTDDTPCYEPVLSQVYQVAKEEYDLAIATARAEFKTSYNTTCSAAFATEHFEYTGPFNQYQYTLFYYDQAGNLIKTVAPKGVTPLATTTAVVTSRDNTTSIMDQDPAVVPTHTFKTDYVYNSYDQLVNTTNPDQTGATKFWYDRYGRMVASQNPVQLDSNKYSYVLYDIQGRPVEVGQADRDYGVSLQRPVISETDLKLNDKGAAFKAWLYSCVRTEVTYSVYDESMFTTSAAQIAKFGKLQENVRLRVANVVYFDAVSASVMPTTGYVSASHYWYDLHGNVTEVLQDVPALTPVQQDLKSTRYSFELISGNVKKVEYNKERWDNSTTSWKKARDYFTHEYVYDALNRLAEVWTSSDGGVHKSRDAHYRYFDYGPASRVEIGHHKVQGNDFAYTINGWLKGMNSTSLNRTRDGGRDGALGYLGGNAEANAGFARDVTGYTMGYFTNDYKSIATTSFEASVGSSNPLSNAIKALYNGNIAYTTTAIDGFATQASVYTYDQLQRLKGMDVYRSASAVNNLNNWSDALYTDEYKSTYAYDANGNLQTLERNGTIALGLSMDDFVYNYTTTTNRLSHVTDIPNGASVAYGDDINDGQVANNYQYDKLGQLVVDVQENQSYKWRSGDKKLKLQKSSSRQLEFVYNAFGQRVLKIEKRVSGGVVQPQTAGVPWAYTYYSYDANGQVMATYNVVMNTVNSVNTAALDEQMIYGSGRLGVVQSENNTYVFNQTALPDQGSIWINKLGKKNYELTNHLGNVNAVITDRKVVNTGYVVNAFTSSIDGWSNCTNVNPLVVNPLLPNQLNVTFWGTSNCVFKTFTTVSGQNYTVRVKSAKGSTTGLKIKAFGSSLISSVNLDDNAFTTYVFQANSASTSLIIETVASTSSGNYSVDEVSFTPNSIYEAVVIMKSDYYPFGATMTGRNVNSPSYRFGFTGKEKDDELKGSGNSYDFGERQYDPRLGRWLSLDPMKAMYPSMSPYCYAGNSPIACLDPDGNFIIFINGFRGGVVAIGDDASPAGEAYWGTLGFVDAAQDYFNDFSGNVFLDGSEGQLGLSKASDRRVIGHAAGVAIAAQIKATLAALGEKETIKILTHSMGAAYAEGFIDALIEEGIKPEQIEKVVHLSAADAADITISEKSKSIKRVQMGVDQDYTLFRHRAKDDPRTWALKADPYTEGKDRMIPDVNIYGEINVDGKTMLNYRKYLSDEEAKVEEEDYDYHAYTKWKPEVFDALYELEHSTKNYQKTYCKNGTSRTYYNITFGNDKFRWNAVKRGANNIYLTNVNKDGSGHNYAGPKGKCE